MYQQNHSPESTEENDKASLTASPSPPRKRLFLYATSSILFVVICAALVFSPPRPGGYPPLCGVPVLNSHKSTVCVEVPQITQGERRMTDGREVLTERASFACNGDTTAFDPVECASKCNGDMLWVEEASLLLEDYTAVVEVVKNGKELEFEMSHTDGIEYVRLNLKTKNSGLGWGTEDVGDGWYKLNVPDIPVGSDLDVLRSRESGAHKMEYDFVFGEGECIAGLVVYYLIP